MRSFHRTIPLLVGRVRRRLASYHHEHPREIVLDLSDVPPTPVAAPLLFLVRLLRRLADVDGRVKVTGLTPALAAALTSFDLPEGVALVDTTGRRWPH